MSERSYEKESKKTTPSGVRFDKEQLDFIQKRESKLNTKQKVVDYLLNKYWWEQKVILQPNHKGLPPQNNIQDLTKPTNEIKAHEQPKTNYAINTAPQQSEPLMTKFMVYKQRISETKTVGEIEKVVAEIKKELFLTVGEKKSLEALAKEHSKGFYND